MLKIGSVIAEKYEVVESLISGELSKVYVVKDKQIDVLRVMKVINTSRPQDNVSTSVAINEVSILKQLDAGIGPELIDVIDHGVLIYIVMSYIKGQTLLQLMQSPLSPSMMHTIVTQLLHTLQRLHDQHLIHGDLKPEHIIVSNRSVCLVDFGVSTPSSSQTNMSHMGTPYYAMPDQYKGYRGVPSDLYAVGKIVVQLLSSSNSNDETLQNVVRQCQLLTPQSTLTATELLSSLQQHMPEKRRLSLGMKRLILGGHIILMLGGVGLSLLSYQQMQQQRTRYEMQLQIDNTKSIVEQKEDIYLAIQWHPEKLSGYHKLLDVIENTGVFSSVDHQYLLTHLAFQKGQFEGSKQDIGAFYKRLALIYTLYTSAETLEKRFEQAMPYYLLAKRYPTDSEDSVYTALFHLVSTYDVFVHQKNDAEKIKEVVRAQLDQLDRLVLNDPQFPFQSHAYFVYDYYMHYVLQHKDKLMVIDLSIQDLQSLFNRLADGLQRVPVTNEQLQQRQQHWLNRRQEHLKTLEQVKEQEKK